MVEAKTTAKIRKKIWVSLVAPKIFREMEVGQTYVYEAEQTIGKTITANLMSLTNDMKKQNVSVKFKVKEIKEGKGQLDIMGMYIIPTSIRRLVRKGRERIDMSIVCKTNDDKKVRIKPLLITRVRVTSSVRNHIHHTVLNFVADKISKMSFSNLINDVINYRLQREVREVIKKVYPLKTTEFRVVELVKDTTKLTQTTGEPVKLEPRKRPEARPPAAPRQPVQEKPAPKVEEVKTEEPVQKAAEPEVKAEA